MSNKYIECLELLKNLSRNSDYLYSEEINEIEELLDSNNFKIAIIGEFSVGKSTFLNGIIGKRVLYSSAQEATGVVTSIVNSNKKCAEIIYENNPNVAIGLEEKNSYIELKEFLDKNKKASDIKAVNINYPISGVDEEVVFLDTPGLQGIGKRELLITKEALKSANATIVVINAKGLSGSELKLLKGELKEFGKIRTKEIILVINKIGEIYNNRLLEEANFKINEIINDVKKVLSENNLNHVKLFAIDSRDYLWAIDDDLYDEVLKNNNNVVRKILTQEEYLERSRFNEFKNYLRTFLSTDNRERAFYEDIEEKLVILLEEFKKYLEGNKSNNYEKIQMVLEQLSKQKSDILENRRRMINATKIQLNDSIRDFKDILTEEIKKDLKFDNQELVKTIEEQVNSLSDLNEFTPSYIEHKVRKMVNEKSKIYIKDIYRYQSNIKDILNKSFDEVFKKFFNSRSRIDFKLTQKNIEIDLKFKVNVRDNDIKNLEKEIYEKTVKLKELKIKFEQFNSEQEYDEKIKNIEKRMLINEEARDSEITSLGNKPKPTQRYRTETREKRSFLIFKKTYEVEVPDGLDYSKVREWEKRCEEIRKKYINDNIELNRLINKIVAEKKLKENHKKEVYNLEDEIKRLVEQKQKSKEKREKMIEFKKEIFLAKKKEELFNEFSKLLDDYMKELKVKLINELEDINDKISSSIEIQIEDYLNKFNNEIEIKYEAVKKDIESMSYINSDYIKEIEIMREKVLEA